MKEGIRQRDELIEVEPRTEMVYRPQIHLKTLETFALDSMF